MDAAAGRVLLRSFLLFSLVPLLRAELSAEHEALTPRRLEIKGSTIPGAGLGVYLYMGSMVVEEGDVVTTYGGEDMLFKELPRTPEAEVYTLRDPLRPDYVRVGKPWTGPVPSVVDPRTLAMGHLLNDGATIRIDQYPGERGLQEKVVAYEKGSIEAANVHWSLNKSWEVVASRHIVPGEELLVTYGATYWLMSILYGSPNPLIRLLIYLFLSEVWPDACDMGAVRADQEGNAILVSTGKEVDEDWCRKFIQEVMGLTDENRKTLEAARDEGGELTWKDMLYLFIDRMLDMEETKLPDVKLENVEDEDIEEEEDVLTATE